MSELEENFIHTKFGYCYYEIKTGKAPIIFNLYVHPEYRRTGKAKELLRYVISQIRSSGYKGEIEIEATPREQSISRKDLKVFYESMGLLVIKSSPVNELLDENDLLHGLVKELISAGQDIYKDVNRDSYEAWLNLVERIQAKTTVENKITQAQPIPIHNDSKPVLGLAIKNKSKFGITREEMLGGQSESDK